MLSQREEEYDNTPQKILNDIFLCKDKESLYFFSFSFEETGDDKIIQEPQAIDYSLLKRDIPLKPKKNLFKVESTKCSYKCSFASCSKVFNKKLNMEKHLKAHLDRKQQNFQCCFANCGKVYKSKENLELHFKNKHLHLKPYSCEFCQAKFSHRNGKIYHERKFHTRLLPYKCSRSDCTEAFANKSALTYHLKTLHFTG